MPRNRQLGQATVAILRAMQQGSRFGLEIMDATGLPSGTVYPTLSRLEQRGFVSCQWEDRRTARKEGRPRRRYYQITKQGRAALSTALVRLGSLLSPLDAQPSPGP